MPEGRRAEKPSARPTGPTTPDAAPLAPVPPGDHRPNTGLREGDIPHGEVNEAVRSAVKTVVFGQQTRLRLGLAMEDVQLPRLHAGHDLVKFFYGGIRQIPARIVDALLAYGISVTLVKDRDLLVYHHLREHQSFHVGRTRRTLYMPESVLVAAQQKGYDYWALAEVVIQESWPLLDYLLILELVRHVQVRMRSVALPGFYFIKDTLRRLNHHRVDGSLEPPVQGQPPRPEDDELAEFYRRYAPEFLAWDRRILDRDPYDVADEVFDEYMERIWASWKIDQIVHVYRYPTYFQLDRDIVHYTVRQIAAARNEEAAPRTVADAVHDLGDVARFRVGRQVKTEPLLDFLIDAGAPGVMAMASMAAEERATGRRVVTANYFDGYDTLNRYREKLALLHGDGVVEHSDSPAMDFDVLLRSRLLAAVRDQLGRFRSLPRADQEESLPVLRGLMVEVVSLSRPGLTGAAIEQVLDLPAHFVPGQVAAAWLELAARLMGEAEAGPDRRVLVTILSKLVRHQEYHGLFLDQARSLAQEPGLSWGANLRSNAELLVKVIPDQAYRFSSDPHAVHQRLKILTEVQRSRPDSEVILTLVAAVLVRLDRAPDYDRYLSVVRDLGPGIRPALEELLEAVGPRDDRRATIRRAAQALLGPGPSPA